MSLMLYGVSITLMILLPVVAAVTLRRFYVTPWFLFCVGMATFVGSQVVHLPLNDWLAEVGLIGPVALDDANFWRTAVVLGLSAGLCETLARVVGFAILFRYRQAQQYEDGVMVGLGHGGIEAMLVGAVLTAASLSSLWALRGVDLATLGLTGEQATAVAAQLAAVEGGGLLPFAGLVERLAAMTLHVALSVLVWRAFKERRWWLVLVALGLHTLFDATAVALTQLTDNVWLIEAVLVTAAALLGVWVWRGWPRNGRPVRLVNPLRVDVQLFLTALRKEMREMWQTRRVIAITAVFLVFGLVSPLLAKFTPQLLMSVEGAEQFADLIPEPTTADAMGQYIKNLTQFAFILVILLGMGAVAGEKDKGTATMILSKPLPRWAFLLSKFSAQAVVYALAMMLAALGAYYYTMVLFEPLLMGPFLLGNVLLWLWLLVLAAVTLLGSSLARSVGMAAGLALFGGVLVLLSGSLPRVGPLMPGALVAWASQLGLVAEVPANGGAVALGMVLMVVCLVTAVAVFEQQEL